MPRPASVRGRRVPFRAGRPGDRPWGLVQGAGVESQTYFFFFQRGLNIPLPCTHGALALSCSHFPSHLISHSLFHTAARGASNHDWDR